RAADRGFTLVQGPPGTGKTSTLLGLLNTLHLCGFHRYYERVLARIEQKVCSAAEAATATATATAAAAAPPHGRVGATHADGEGTAGGSVVASILAARADLDQALHAVAMSEADRPRILVAAPSNAAVDEIAARIMRSGFTDGQGARYNPAIVRVGAGQSDALRDISLHEQARAALASR
ncbi:MAG: AAA domain-containing protein, partial [Dietzia sp.]